MDISVIIINYNTTELTVNCIKSVLEHTRSNTFEIILIDNASKDRSIQKISTLFPDVRMIYNSVNVGFGRACNQGIECSKGKYILLLNSDAQIISDAPSTFFHYMEDDAHRAIGCCGATLISVDGQLQVSYGNFPTLKEAISTLGFNRFYKGYFDQSLSSGVVPFQISPHLVDYVSGAVFFVRRSALNAAGNFDEDFFLYFEETELSYRMKKMGYLSAIIPELKVIHIVGGSHEAGKGREKSKIYSVSRILFFEKCYGKTSAMLVKYLYQLQEGLMYIYKSINKVK
jgi:hypothetical protein